MAAGSASWSDISAVANDIMESSLAVARAANLLIPTVTQYRGSDMAVRNLYQWGEVGFSAHTEETDEASTAFTKSALMALTPINYMARADITDEMLASDWDDIKAALSLEFGSGAANHVDEAISDLFSTATGWTGGTIGPALAGTAANGTITWRAITKAYALLKSKNPPAGQPTFCALHPFQWEVLLAANSVAAATVAVSPAFQDRMVTSPNFFTIPQFNGITFVVDNNIDVASTAAYGLMYVPGALALDTRKPLYVEPQRDASKAAWEMVAGMWYAVGARNPNWGVLLRHQAATPS